MLGQIGQSKVDSGVGRVSPALYHIGAGGIFGATVFFSIISRSLSPAISILGLCAFCAVPAVAKWLLKRSAAPARHLGATVLAAWCAVLVLWVARGAEHLYMMNGSYYPTWLATAVAVTPEQVGVIAGSESLCHGHGIGEYIQKSNGMFLRCGGGFAPKTFYIENYREAYLAWLKQETPR